MFAWTPDKASCRISWRGGGYQSGYSRLGESFYFVLPTPVRADKGDQTRVCVMHEVSFLK